MSAESALRRRVGLQERLWESAHGRIARSPSAKHLHREIQAYLLKASDRRLIVDAPHAIRQRLLFLGPDDHGYFEIAIGTKRNFHRLKELPHLARPDGAWFDFQLLLREQGNAADIIAYDFEIRLPPEVSPPFSFVRFDLNPPGHENQQDGLRSHLHLSSDDDGFSIPAPVMSPFEILDLFIFGLRRTGRVRLTPMTGALVIPAQ